MVKIPILLFLLSVDKHTYIWPSLFLLLKVWVIALASFGYRFSCVLNIHCQYRHIMFPRSIVCESALVLWLFSLDFTSTLDHVIQFTSPVNNSLIVDDGTVIEFRVAPSVPEHWQINLYINNRLALKSLDKALKVSVPGLVMGNHIIQAYMTDEDDRRVSQEVNYLNICGIRLWVTLADAPGDNRFLRGR